MLGAQAKLMISPVENRPSETGLSLMDGAPGCAGVLDHLYRSSPPSVAMYSTPVSIGSPGITTSFSLLLFVLRP